MGGEAAFDFRRVSFPGGAAVSLGGRTLAATGTTYPVFGRFGIPSSRVRVHGGRLTSGARHGFQTALRPRHRFIALRFFSVWGPGHGPDLAMECFRRRIMDGKPIVINGDGSQRRDLTHVDDVARAVELALHWPGPGSAVLNIGTGRNHSVMDMLDAAQKVVAALHFSESNFTLFTPPVVHQNAHPADVPETRASLMAVRKELGWAPRIFFPETSNSDAKKV